MYNLNHKTLCLTSNPALGSAELPFLVQKNERAPPYVMPLAQSQKIPSSISLLIANIPN